MPYKNKNTGYFGRAREDLASLIPDGPNVVLEIGSGNGSTGIFLKTSGKAAFVAGVEIFKEAANAAQTRLDCVITGDIETAIIPFPPGHFNYILCGDVLEHLIDPWKMVKTLTSLLAPGGAIIASIPNIRHYRVIKNLVFKGEWRYTSEGILDNTHLRFFTRKTALTLFEQAGLKAEVSAVTYGKKEDRWFARLTGGLLTDFAVLQFLITATKSPFNK